MIFNLSINNRWMVLCHIRLFPFECLYIITNGAWKGTWIRWNLKANLKEWTFKPRPTYYGINYHGKKKKKKLVIYMYEISNIWNPNLFTLIMHIVVACKIIAHVKRFQVILSKIFILDYFIGNISTCTFHWIVHMCTTINVNDIKWW